MNSSLKKGKSNQTSSKPRNETTNLNQNNSAELLNENVNLESGKMDSQSPTKNSHAQVTSHIEKEAPPESIFKDDPKDEQGEQIEPVPNQSIISRSSNNNLNNKDLNKKNKDKEKGKPSGNPTQDDGAPPKAKRGRKPTEKKESSNALESNGEVNGKANGHAEATEIDKSKFTPYDFLKIIEEGESLQKQDVGEVLEQKKQTKKGGRKKNKGDDSDESFRIEDEEKLMRKPKESKANVGQEKDKIERPIPKIDRSVEVTHIMNLEELNTKSKITNSEMILSIMEITTNAKYYGMVNSTRSRIFWEVLENVEEYQNIFGNFKSETLRKYWRMLSSVDNPEKIVTVVRENQKNIDNTLLKLLTLITTIVDFLKGKVKNIHNALNTLIKNQLLIHSGNPDRPYKPRASRAHKGKSGGLSPQDLDYEADPEELEYGDNLDNKGDMNNENEMLSRKRLRPRKEKVNYLEIEEAKLFSDSGSEEEDEEEEENDKGDMMKKYNFDLIKQTAVTQEDKEIFEKLNAVVKVFQENFPDRSTEDIIEALKATSLNLKNAYRFLKDPIKLRDFVFSEPEDYIISNMKNSEFYKQLVESKGATRVQEREKFLS